MALRFIITAGGELPRDMAHLGMPGCKALIPLHGSTLLDKALAAAGGLPRVRDEDIAVVGPPEVAAALPAGIAHVPSGGSVIDNLLRGFERLGGQGHDYVVLGADLAFPTAEQLARFVDLAPREAEIAVPVITRDDFLRRFPGAPNRFERVDGRELTLASAFYFTGPALHSNIPLMRDFAKYRKSPLKLALLLGWPVLWGFITKRIRLETLERRFSALTGARVRAVQLDAPELAFDIDTLAEYEYARDL